MSNIIQFVPSDGKYTCAECASASWELVNVDDDDGRILVQCAHCSAEADNIFAADMDDE